MKRKFDLARVPTCCVHSPGSSQFNIDFVNDTQRDCLKWCKIRTKDAPRIRLFGSRCVCVSITLKVFPGTHVPRTMHAQENARIRVMCHEYRKCTRTYSEGYAGADAFVTNAAIRHRLQHAFSDIKCGCSSMHTHHTHTRSAYMLFMHSAESVGARALSMPVHIPETLRKFNCVHNSRAARVRPHHTHTHIAPIHIVCIIHTQTAVAHVAHVRIGCWLCVGG